MPYGEFELTVTGSPAWLPPEAEHKSAPAGRDLGEGDRIDRGELRHQPRNRGSTTAYSTSVSRFTTMKPRANTSVTPCATA